MRCAVVSINMNGTKVITNKTDYDPATMVLWGEKSLSIPSAPPALGIPSAPPALGIPSAPPALGIPSAGIPRAPSTTADGLIAELRAEVHEHVPPMAPLIDHRLQR